MRMAPCTAARAVDEYSCKVYLQRERLRGQNPTSSYYDYYYLVAILLMQFVLAFISTADEWGDKLTDCGESPLETRRRS